MELIEHAWSVLCERAAIDAETNNVALNVLEQLNVPPLPPLPADQKGYSLPVPARFVSLWYRGNPDIGAKGRCRLLMLDPDSKELLRREVELDLTDTPRRRMLVSLNGIPMTRSGAYAFHVEIERAGNWHEVARVPLQIVDAAFASPAPPRRPARQKPKKRKRR